MASEWLVDPDVAAAAQTLSSGIVSEASLMVEVDGRLSERGAIRERLEQSSPAGYIAISDFSSQTVVSTLSWSTGALAEIQPTSNVSLFCMAKPLVAAAILNSELGQFLDHSVSSLLGGGTRRAQVGNLTLRMLLTNSGGFEHIHPGLLFAMSQQARWEWVLNATVSPGTIRYSDIAAWVVIAQLLEAHLGITMSEAARSFVAKHCPVADASTPSEVSDFSFEDGRWVELIGLRSGPIADDAHLIGGRGNLEAVATALAAIGQSIRVENRSCFSEMSQPVARGHCDVEGREMAFGLGTMVGLWRSNSDDQQSEQVWGHITWGAAGVCAVDMNYGIGIAARFVDIRADAYLARQRLKWVLEFARSGRGGGEGLIDV